MSNDTSQKTGFRFPHTYALIFFIIILAALASYLIPSGEFKRIEKDGRTEIVQGSYSQTDAGPVGIFDLFKAVPEGMIQSADIIFYIFLIGGAFGIIHQTGMINAGVNLLVQRLKTRGTLLIPVIMTVFSLGGATIGLSEETIIFVPVGIAVARALGYDALTGMAMISLGAAAGFTGGMLNPFTVGIAQSIAEVPLFSAFGYRLFVYFLILGFAIFYVMRYAKNVKAHPEKGLLHGTPAGMNEEIAAGQQIVPFHWRHGLVLLIVVLGFAINIFGVFRWGWFLSELSAGFLIIGFAAGLAGGLTINETFESFVDGMKQVAYGALIVGFARAIVVVLEDGQIIDTIINSLASAIGSLPNEIGALGMYAVQVIINTFIPSGSGQAATTMPLMAPLADLLGFERQIAVFAFQYGDGITNSIIPTSGVLMAALAIAGIPYDRWLKFVWKLIAGWLIIAAAAIVIAMMIGIK
ncbi:AbgT family transporter [Bacillus sonorensis]|uniref:YfcC family protein n=1 Tax=Bacillus sonorensis TaxID=119858 RepID=UPI00227FDFA0|nr:Na+/H+ antiporter NhaC family protein [Bacillus sonorensis]MCZ0070052.1 AbgT family transporter [Bacillus sonorensis]MCZ0097440.1 AbgT family transporter [Bacillus sonorensis]MEC1516825.1 AbgT family transporter [Bacillus sonorensis]